MVKQNAHEITYFRFGGVREAVSVSPLTRTRNGPVAISPYFSPNSPLAGNPAKELATTRYRRLETALAVSLRAGTTPAEMHTRLHQLRIVSDIGSPHVRKRLIADLLHM